MRLWLTPSRLIAGSLVAASLSFFYTLSAQTTTSGALTGVITDQTSAVVPNAEVEIKDTAKGTTRSTKSDREGLYHLFSALHNKL